MFQLKEDTLVMSTSELQRNIGKIRQKGKPILVTKNNRPYVVLLDYEEYQKLQERLEELEDVYLGAVAEERAKKKGKIFSQEEVEHRYGLRH
ncbi:MAG TPA: type II toxin-antitoxin system Phd/YefM family antitoxin [Candidatus Hypogeohydataceae bacterium YC41]